CSDFSWRSPRLPVRGHRRQGSLTLPGPPSGLSPRFTHRMSTGHSLLRSTFAHTFDPDTSHVGSMFVHPRLHFVGRGLLTLNTFGVPPKVAGKSFFDPRSSRQSVLRIYPLKFSINGVWSGCQKLGLLINSEIKSLK